MGDDAGVDEVWVAETWSAYGEDRGVHGVFESREAAFESLKALPNMTVYVGDDGFVHGRPVKERSTRGSLREWMAWSLRNPEKWAVAEPYKVQGRALVTPPQ